MPPVDRSQVRAAGAAPGESRPPSREPILPFPQRQAKAIAPVPTRPALSAIHSETAAGLWLRHLVGEQAFEAAASAAARHGTRVHTELLAAGRLEPARYAQALAQALDVPCALHLEALHAPVAQSDAAAPITAWMGRAGTARAVIDATTHAPDIVAAHLARLRARGIACCLAPRSAIEQASESLARAARIDAAVNELRRTQPESSAASGWHTWQVLLPIMALGAAAGSIMVVPEAAVAGIGTVVALPFLAVTVLRLLALREIVRIRRKRRHERRALPAFALPRYSVLVPLFRESAVIPDLVAALGALDYPRTKLEVLLLIESVDLETQAALLKQRLPPHFKVIEVPDCAPRTKPKALNYALGFASGDLLVVYDAEDRPQPSQLRHAAEVFASAAADVGCVQARLNIYNPGQSWLSRQFTIEYSALFDAILPSLERHGLPIPLGGTSNHFRGIMQQAHLAKQFKNLAFLDLHNLQTRFAQIRGCRQ
ncbi:MAG: glycosyltransferase [Hyphomicrobiaceae bacterium]|nr:glycosyltransferase [Hyphomicrobiaceae bacterium]